MSWSLSDYGNLPSAESGAIRTSSMGLGGANVERGAAPVQGTEPPALGERSNSGDSQSPFVNMVLNTETSHLKAGPGFDQQNEKVGLRDLLGAATGQDTAAMEEIELILSQAERIFGVESLACLCSPIGETFVGTVVAGIPEQMGLLEFPPTDPLSRSTYRGQWDEGRRHGLGVLRWSDGTIYEGELREDQSRGYGVETYADGGVYSGQFVDDSRCGFGVYAFADGRTFAGGWIDGMPHGAGIETIRKEGEADTMLEVLARCVIDSY